MRRSTTTSPTPGESGDGPTAERGNFTPPSTAPSAAPSGSVLPDSGSRLAPRNWRVATRLNAILLLPVLVALVFAGLRVHSHYETWQEADRAERVAALVQASTRYAHAIIDERDVSARPLLEGDTDSEIIADARRATDAARAEFEARAAETPLNDNLRNRLALVEQNEPRLVQLREAAYTDAIEEPDGTEVGYVDIQNPLMSFANDLSLGEDNTSYGRSVYSVSLATAAHSLQRALGVHLLVADDAPAQDTATRRLTFASFAYLENVAQREYQAAATPEERERLVRTLGSSTEVETLTNMVQAIASGQFSTEELAEMGITADSWFAASTARFDAYHGVEQELVADAVEHARTVAADARTNMIVNSVLVVVLLLAAFVIAALMARSMSKNMRRLRHAALGIAENRLPALVDQLSRTDPGHVDTEVRPIPINSTDEIGEVSRAFDQVHREAVRLAAEQALLRGNVNAMFTNLSSRNQGLIERQLGLITELENNEADPEQLENLFRLDHLATRMRRNGENLLVLAGEEPGRRWNQPVPLVDVLRAAASEVEQYHRIELAGVPDSEIHGAVVTDLVHLLAELLENATSFSSPQTKVKVTATRLPDGRVMVEIHDKGIGLTAEDFAEINHRLADPPAVDVEVSRRMGLFVVGRLAMRHGIRVQLRPSGEQSGTTSLVMLPEAITHGGGGAAAPEEEFTVSRIVPDGPFATEGAGTGRTAAELGFDDSRYAAAEAAGLDPVSRSLRRGERHVPIAAAYSADEPYQGEGGDHPDQGYRDGNHQDQGYRQQDHRDPGHREPRQEQTYRDPAYSEHGYQDQAYRDQAYRDQAYQDTAFREQGFAAGGYPDGGYPRQDGGDGSHSGPGYSGDAFGDGPAAAPAPGGYAAEASGPSLFGGGPEHTGTHPMTPPDGAQRVGFDGAGPPPDNLVSSTTDAGLPRREPQRRTDDVTGEQRVREESVEQAPHESQWDRGPRREAARTGGITSSGLPKRVPKANLTEHTTAQPAAGGPQVSRSPEDVRGRLSNLHRGVRQGRGASKGRAQNDHEGFGPGNDQER